ncbi:MAG: hypothetical protein R3E12_20550 [Candidatus Eisenbacteria bacterium]|uniref:Peptidase C-terminal archaeal/bacterial domain-containing protein n=1 Tax=Eiseniibacteriota bacterium TaxID=2212470 RepID=A0A956M289_UNCEI|nr:hypothetical protein [Candidatus Eisenbacteria bacterium]
MTSQHRPQFLLVAALATFCLGKPAIATDSYEPNDDPTQATELPNDVTLESWISTPTDIDWYHFEHADPEQRITIELTSLPVDVDYDMQLYFRNAQGQLDLVATAENPANQDEVITGIGPAGHYFLVVYGFESTDFDPVDSYLLHGIYGEAPPVPVVSTSWGKIKASYE